MMRYTPVPAHACHVRLINYHNIQDGMTCRERNTHSKATARKQMPSNKNGCKVILRSTVLYKLPCRYRLIHTATDQTYAG